MRKYTIIKSVLLTSALLIAGCSSQSDDSEIILANMKTDPVMSALMSSNPDAEAKIKKIVEDIGGEPDELQADKLRELVHPILIEHASAREDNLDDAAVSRVGSIMAQIILKRATDPGVDCSGQVAGLARGNEMDPVMVEIIKADPNFVPRVATVQDMAQVLSRKVPEIASRGGLDVNFLGAVYSGQVQATPEVTCRIKAGSLATLAELPPSEGAPLIRVLTGL